MAPAAPPTGPNGQMPDWTKTPLVPPPSGISNFVDPPSLAPMAIAVSSVMLGLMVPSVLLRFYARTHIVAGIGADDWVGLVAAIFTAGFTIYSIVLFTLPGLGPHLWDIPAVVFFDTKYGLRMLFTEVLYCPCAYFTKLSMFLLYKRVFVSPGSRTKYFVSYGLWVTTVLYFALLILNFAFCIPDTSLVDGGSCSTKGGQVGWAQSAVNIATDIYLLAIPPAVISKLHISPRRKWGVAGIFIIGVAATVASIVALAQRIILIGKVPDFSWGVMPAAVATICELNLGVICSCLPAVSVLFRKSTSAAKNSSSRFGWSLQHLMSRTFRTRTQSSTEVSLSKNPNESTGSNVATINLVSVSSDKMEDRPSTLSYKQIRD